MRFRAGAEAPGRGQRAGATVLVVALLVAGGLMFKFSSKMSAAVGLKSLQTQQPKSSVLDSLRSTIDRTTVTEFLTGNTAADSGPAVVQKPLDGGGSGSSSGGTSGSSGGASDGSVGGGGDTPLRAEQPWQRIKYEPLAKADPAFVEKRCVGAIGDWCGRYHAQAAIPAKAPPRGNRTCLWNCNFVGVCDAMRGWCRCPAGWTGDDCSTRMKRPCSQQLRQHGFEAYNKPTDLSAGGLTMSCADLCDEDVGQCFCNSTFAHGRVPADPTLPPGTPPQRIGRPLPNMCKRNKDYAGKPTNFGQIEPELMYGANGWCQADKPGWTCPCILDGRTGAYCDEPLEPFCPNQCSGHGECQTGFCKCHAGWFGHDCAFRTSDTPYSAGMEEGERPWLKNIVRSPASRDPEPGATRKRPLIFVYELPPLYNEALLQYRTNRADCVHRYFTGGNGSSFNDPFVYNSESGLHEMLLQSEHRTLDPEEADYFYLPVYASCFIFPILGAADFPYFHGGPVAWRTHAAANMFIEVFHWIRSHYLYWDRNGGRDHMVLAVHDEGSCWVPAVLRPAIVLSHWGRTDKEHLSDTGYWPDSYSNQSQHKVWQPEGHLGKLGNFPCYDPAKDLVLPPMFSPHKYTQSPLLGGPPRERQIFAFFKGRLLTHVPKYSRGLRQFLDKYCRDNDWWGKHKIYIGEHTPPGESSSYSELLASSTFCFAIMGDGFSSRFEDGLLHGCIPVIIQDGVDMSLSSLLDVEKYSIRVKQADITRIPEILKAVSKEEIARMQALIAKVAKRYVWAGLPVYKEAALQAIQARIKSAKPELQQAAIQPEELEDDAFSTMIQWLYSRLGDLGAHAAPPVAQAK